MKAIVCADEKYAIGYQGKLLYHIPADLSRFSTLTTSNIVVMGRKTFMSLPNKKPLKNRTNIVITKKQNFSPDGVVVLHDIESLGLYCIDHAINTDSIWVIGGASIYNQLLPYCSHIYMTKVHDSSAEADAYFPNIDELNNQSDYGRFYSVYREFHTYKHWNISEAIRYSYIIYKQSNYAVMNKLLT